MSTWNLNFGIPVGNVTPTAFSGYTGGVSIGVLLGAVTIPLTTSTYTNGIGFVANRDYVVISNAGTYAIDYKIRTTLALGVSSGVLKNGALLPSLNCAPGIAGSSFSGSSIVNLTTGDQLALALYGLVTTAVLIGGPGAVLNIIRIA